MEEKKPDNTLRLILYSVNIFSFMIAGLHPTRSDLQQLNFEGRICDRWDQEPKSCLERRCLDWRRYFRSKYVQYGCDLESISRKSATWSCRERFWLLMPPWLPLSRARQSLLPDGFRLALVPTAVILEGQRFSPGSFVC